MKRYEIIIKPLSPFGTPLKGDTLFGQFCWQLFYKIGQTDSRFETLIKNYFEKPFVVFSSAIPALVNPEKRYIMKKPDIPSEFIISRNGMTRIEFQKKAKQLRSKKWMLVDENLIIDLSKPDIFFNDHELIEFFMNEENGKELIIHFEKAHNSINRLTGSTGKDMFAPFHEDTFCYHPDLELAIIALVDESQISIEELSTCIGEIGGIGFGKDASTGNGRFSITSCKKIKEIETVGVDAIYSLAPSVPGKESFDDKFFKLFVRFGKHGGGLATTGNPFKKPVMMEDEGAVYLVNENNPIPETPYIGCAVSGVSKSQTRAVVQGYTPYLPVKNLVKL